MKPANFNFFNPNFKPISYRHFLFFEPKLIFMIYKLYPRSVVQKNNEGNYLDQIKKESNIKEIFNRRNYEI